MLFNSLHYLFFLPVCVIAYYITPQRCKNLFLLIASYCFYMCWVPQYALLIGVSTFVTWITSFLVAKLVISPFRKLALAGNLIINLGILFVFKYYNFFMNLLLRLFALLDISFHYPQSSLLLPVGISFYTFQALGYSIDVYRGDIKHEKNFINYALFVSFFPQLVAGPIERSKNLMNQLKRHQPFSIYNAKNGLRLIVWGLFKKIAVADMSALFIDRVFNAPGVFSGLTIIVAVFIFSIQIYCDFSGYSDVARGTAQIFGIQLMENFNAPYFSTSITEFWSRWHISLSTWFRDYLYIPIGGGRKGFPRKLANITVVFLVSGLWHGASITFVAWGVIHAIYRVFDEAKSRIWKPGRSVGRLLDATDIIAKTGLCYLLTCFGWIFFRADSMAHVGVLLKRAFTNLSFLQFKVDCYQTITLISPNYKINRWLYVLIVAVSICIVFITDGIKKYKSIEPVRILCAKNTLVRWTVYYTFILTIMYCFIMTTNQFGQAGAFLYFQF